LLQTTRQVGVGATRVIHAPAVQPQLLARSRSAGGQLNRLDVHVVLELEHTLVIDFVSRCSLAPLPAGVSHDLKTPLTSMRGYVETLRIPDIALSQEQRGQYLDTIERETRRLERIVQDLLDIARIENDAIALDQRYFDTWRLFQHVVERHQAGADARRVRLATLVHDEADQLFGDPDRLEQVVDNLVANAIRHTAYRGHVELRAQLSSTGAEIAVSDDGEGIAVEHLRHIFDRFYKVDEARASGASGSGLGLSIARAIVERHGGTIAVESRRGRTVFTVRLPQPVVDERVQQASANL